MEKSKKKPILTIFLLISSIAVVAQQTGLPKLVDPYLGQNPPGTIPEVFAPDIIFSDNAVHGHIAVTPDGNEIYWIFLSSDYRKNPPVITFVKQTNGAWSEPMELEFNKPYGINNFSLSPDGKRIYFLSNRPLPGSTVLPSEAVQFEDNKIWYVERHDYGWGEPKLLHQSINHNIRGVSATNDGTLYTHGIRRSRMENGKYRDWETMPAPLTIGTILGGNPFISPDESYILFNKKWPGKSGYAICISYRLKDDCWTQPLNLLEKLNASRGGSQPYVTPDGKYLFHYAGGRFYWVKAKIIEELRPKE